MVDNQMEQLISQADAAEYLNISYSDFAKIREVFSLEMTKAPSIKGQYQVNYYLRSDIEKIRIERNEFFENHLTLNEVVQILNISRTTVQQIIEPVRIPKGFAQSNCIYMYSKADVYKVKSHNDFVIENCLFFTEARKYLCADEKRFYVLANKFKLKEHALYGKSYVKYYLKSDLDLILSEQKAFFENHFTPKEACAALSIGYHPLAKLSLTKIDLPQGYIHPDGMKPHYMYRKDDILNLSENDLIEKAYVPKTKVVHKGEIKRHVKIDPNKYTSRPDAMNYLNLNLHCFRETVKEFNLELNIECSGRTRNYYLRKDIEKLRKKQVAFWEDHISRSEVKSINKNVGGNHKVYLAGFEKIKVPSYAKRMDRYASGDNLKNLFCFKRSEIINRINELDKKNQILNSYGSTYFDTFKIRMDLIANELTEFNSSFYTREKWYKFVDSKLNDDKQHPSSAASHITMYMNLAVLISKAMRDYDVPEIYSLKPSEIAMIHNSATISYRPFLFMFLESVEEDVRLRLLKSGSDNTKGFNLEKTKEQIKAQRPKDIETVNNETQEIYDFDTYSNVFNYLCDIKLHTRISIERMQNDGNTIYPSIWVYLMLHLNNAWRNGDVADFPRLHVYDLMSEFDINGIEWLENNEITAVQARRIITRIIEKEFKISKTQLKGHFFSSNVLAPALATGIMLIEAFLMSNGITDSKKEYVPLLNFNTKYNKPSENRIRKFLQGMDGYEDFVFRSRKMNKTIMTFIYHLSQFSGDDNALKYVQRLRGHNDPSSPLYYVDWNLKRVERLTEELFLRGEFGYIPSLLIQKLEGKPFSFEEMTRQVERVNATFCDVFKLESTIGFCNTVKQERAKVIRLLETKTLEECQHILTEIFTGNLPSKEKDVQCLVSKQGCKRHDKNCFDCEYHIPSIYALTTLCLAILNDVKEYHKATSNVKKMKKALGVERKMIVFQEAIQKYGREYVYNCLGLSKEQLLDMLEEIPESSEFGEIFEL